MSLLENLRFSYEKKLFFQLKINPFIAHIPEVLQGQNEINMYRQYLLSSAVKVTPSLLPDLYNLYKKCLGFIDDKIRGDLYVQQRSEYNAFVYCINNRFDIVISSSIIKEFRKEEIAFVIGHELGHVIFHHNKIPAGAILSRYKDIPYELAYLLTQWSRAGEISADRIGLLCSGGLCSAASAFFKLTSGLSVENEDEMIRSLREQYHEIKTLITTQWQSDEWLATHPLIPIRFKSLELIALDILSLRQQNLHSMPRGFQLIDSQIAEVLTETEPFEDKSFLRSKEGLSVLILCLLYVAVSDGEINKLEESLIYNIKNKAGFDINLEETLSACKRDVVMFKEIAISDLSHIKIIKNDVIKILQFCYSLAVIDNTLCDAEIKGMEKIGKSLGCEPWLVDSVIKTKGLV